MSRAMLVFAMLAGCSTPDLKIIYTVADGTAGPSCGSTQCADVPMACDSVLHLRVLRPSDPTAPFVSICEEVKLNQDRDLCAIGNIGLPPIELPRETLEIQVTVWPLDKVLDPETGDLDCGRVPVEFDATMGFPIPVAGGDIPNPNPAFGGRAFYHPGDTETFVNLGCVDVESVNNTTCGGGQNIEVTSTVGDFENLPFSVSPVVGDRLLVAVGEPESFDDGIRTGHRLRGSNLHDLDRIVDGPTPTWGGNIADMFTSSACIQVLEDVGQATSAIRCRNVLSFDTSLDLAGARFPKSTLDQVLAALQLTEFPESGITIGIVLDNFGNPSPNKVVVPTQGTIEYLSGTRTGLVPGQTSSSGIFVSRDAPYGTFFTVTVMNQSKSALGGRVDEKVTIAVIQFDEPVIGD